MKFTTIRQRHAEGLKRGTLAGASFVLLLVLCGHASADTFGSGDNSFDIDFVAIGNPGNFASTFGTPRNGGAVEYDYRMGKYEISRDMVDKVNADGELKITMNSMSYVPGGPRPDMPAAGISWNEAARFVNWLNDSVGSSQAYNFAAQPGEEGYRSTSGVVLWQEGDPGFDVDNPFRNSQAKYVLPSVDEWFKAAFFDPNANDGTGGYWRYATGSDVAPTPVASGTDPGTAIYGQSQSQGPADITEAGGLSPYGAMAMGGNVIEWSETSVNRNNRSASSGRLRRGGNWFFDASLMPATYGGDKDANFTGGNNVFGFRVASVGEVTDVPLLAGDADLDGEVSFADFLVLSDNFGRAGGWSEGDFDLNGTVEFPDFLLLSNNFGKTTVSAAAVPEPNGLIVGCLGSLGLVTFRRHRRSRHR